MNIIPSLSSSATNFVITAEEQLERLVFSVAEQQIIASGLPHFVARRMPSELLVEKGVSILVRSAIQQKTETILSRVFKRTPLQEISPVFTNWYTAYTELRPFFPEKVPSLPEDIHSRMDAWRQKGLNPLLYFVPGGTLNQLEKTMQTYWTTKHPGEENPLRCCCIEDATRKQCGETVVDPHWVLMSDDVIPGSLGEPYRVQLALIEALNLECELPSLYDTVAVLFLHRIAAEKYLYQTIYEPSGIVHPHTRVKEKVSEEPLMVGGFSSSGVGVHANHYARADLGVAVSFTFEPIAKSSR